MSSGVTYTPIGILRSPFTDPAGMPIQPTGKDARPGRIELDPELAEGLKDLEGFSHLILLYHFHRSPKPSLKVVPFLDTVERGIFATRAPRRPNPIGLSVVRLERIEGNVLHLLDVDILDETPVLDIKPYVPAFDTRPDARAGWIDAATATVGSTRSDDRFSKEQAKGHD